MRRTPIIVALLLLSTPALAEQWGAVERKGCARPGYREFTARLWDAEGDWEKACRRVPITIGGTRYTRVARCDYPPAAGVWGVWHLPDKSCANATWLKAKDNGCVANGRREYAARLDDHRGMSWEMACELSPIPYPGGRHIGERRCDNHGAGGMFGVFSVADETCAPRFGPVKAEVCVGRHKRRYTAQLHNIQDWMTGDRYQQVCRAAKATVQGVSAAPDNCERYPLAGVFGVWVRPDVAGCPVTAEEETVARYQAQQAEINAQLTALAAASAPVGGQGGDHNENVRRFMRERLEAEDVDIVTVMDGAGFTAVIGGYTHTEGWAMSAVDGDTYTCRYVWSNSYTAGLSLGASAFREYGLWKGGMDSLAGETNGVQVAVTLLKVNAYLGASHWSPEDGTLVGYTTAEAGSIGLDLGVEYVHVWTGVAEAAAPCDEITFLE